jgi:putative Mn2+ efflux pump MntP
LVNLTSILFVLALTSVAFPLALGLHPDKENRQGNLFLIALLFGAVQAMMVFLGNLLGQQFMHLFSAHHQIVVFAVFGLIAVRMIIEALKIRKENRLFAFESYSRLLIIAIAAAINSLIAGMVGTYFQPFGTALPWAFFIAGFGWSILGLLLPINRINILLASVLQLFFAVVLLIIGLLYLFKLLVIS